MWSSFQKRVSDVSNLLLTQCRLLVCCHLITLIIYLIWEIGVQGAQSAREGAGRAYDATVDTVGSAKDKVWGEQPKAKSSGGVYDSAGNYYKSAKEMAARTGETVQGHASYAGQKASDTAQAAKDAAQRVSELTSL